MADVKITIIENGPAKLEMGSADVLLPNGTTKTVESKLFLCRCGESKKKPLCDGAHKTCGFEG